MFEYSISNLLNSSFPSNMGEHKMLHPPHEALGNMDTPTVERIERAGPGIVVTEKLEVPQEHEKGKRNWCPAFRKVRRPDTSRSPRIRPSNPPTHWPFQLVARG